jgi:SAM-dependent methyltransferase
MLKDINKRIKTALSYPDMAPAAIVERLGLDSRSQYLFAHVVDLLTQLETDPAVDSRDQVLHRLRSLGLGDFGLVLWSMPNPRFPKLSRLLPSMASREVQRSWTGKSGVPLLKQSVGFVQSVAYNYTTITGRTLAGADVLDFGCGYGRLARLMYYFTDEDRYVGVDPWDASLALCKQAGLTRNFLRSEYLPSELPVGDRKFDLLYAFSVFTHLSSRAVLAALSALRKYVKDSGSLLAITIRPIEYWAFASHISADDADRLRRAHDEHGFAFWPHEREPVDGDITYGDTSIALEWFAKHCRDWEVKAIDRSLDDRMQTYVFLTPA